MKGYISLKDLTEVVEFIAAQADKASSDSGLKEKYQSVMYAGWCCAMDAIIFSLGLPIDTDSDPDDSERLRELMSRFRAMRQELAEGKDA